MCLNLEESKEDKKFSLNYLTEKICNQMREKT